MSSRWEQWRDRLVKVAGRLGWRLCLSLVPVKREMSVGLAVVQETAVQGVALILL